jgi:hypothetical protein
MNIVLYRKDSGPLPISLLLIYSTISGENGFTTKITKSCSYIQEVEYTFAIGSEIKSS